MSAEQNKNQLESLSQISIDPGLRDLGGSTIFGGRKSSFDYVNILKDSDQLSKRDYRNSLDILASNINHGKQTVAPLRSIIQVYNDEIKVKIQQEGMQALQIGQVVSESEQEQQQQVEYKREPQDQPLKLETVYNEMKNPFRSFFPHDLATVLRDRQIPLQYVRGLLMARNLKQIKSTRRLKVQRYLEKRRKKTWDRKICYNCRQKVAEQRLRIKGKFIKKRRAMQMLGIKQPIDTAILKQMLYQALKHKNSREIEQLIKNQNFVKYEIIDEENEDNIPKEEVIIKKQ